MAGILGSDIEVDFSEGDILFSSNNDFKVVADADNLEQAIISRLLTKKGDLYSQRTYGSNLYLLIGQTLDEDALNVAGSYVYEALSDEPRINTINDVIIQAQVIDGQNTLVIFIDASSIDSDVDINIVVNYTV